ncbi:MAG: tetratricopeptide repeat protein [Candidatus Margulisbacteria bacterium]|jgi:tetratricopeptide (TPR) repeat protein|nr:tetratricopeptide repeat protein [Candidatus Margulisiibacteriota bacterium]
MAEPENKIDLTKISAMDWLKIAAVLIAAAVILYRCFLPFRAEYAFREAYNLEAQMNSPNLSAERRSAAAQKAIEKYEKVKKLAPWETYYHIQLARIYETQARQETELEKKLEKIKQADDIYDLCLKISPTNPWYVMRKAEIYGLYAEIETDEAKKAELLRLREAKIMESAELDQNNGIFQSAAANLHFQKGELEQAAAKYQHVLEIDDRTGEAYIMLAEIARRQGQPEKIEELYKTLIEKNPAFPNTRLYLGQIYEQRGQLADAIELYKEEALLDKNNETAYRILGSACYRAREWRNMEVAYNRLTIIRPDNVDYYMYKAHAQIQQNKLKEALDAYEAAQALRPDDANIRNNINALKARGI